MATTAALSTRRPWRLWPRLWHRHRRRESEWAIPYLVLVSQGILNRCRRYLGKSASEIYEVVSSKMASKWKDFDLTAKMSELKKEESKDAYKALSSINTANIHKVRQSEKKILAMTLKY